MQPSVILASTSRYRAQLLKRLNIDFQQTAPDCDETPLQDEPADELVGRLAAAKAKSVSAQFPQHVVIGSDQVAACDGVITGKPGSHEDAVAQLQMLSGKTVSFLTGLCVLHLQSQKSLQCLVTTDVSFKKLNAAQIERYLAADQPYDCAASFRSEGYGSTIVTRMSSDDPTAIIGLPVIKTAAFLDELGVQLP